MLHPVLGIGIVGKDKVDLSAPIVCGIVDNVEGRDLSEVPDRDLQAVVGDLTAGCFRMEDGPRQDAGERGQHHHERQQHGDPSLGQMMSLFHVSLSFSK